MVLLNGLLLAAALLLTHLYLRRLGGGGAGASLTLVTFAASGALLPYIAWRTSDAAQAALALAGLALCLGALRGGGEGGGSFFERPWAPAAGGLLLGLLVSMRSSNALIAALPLVALLLARRRRAALTAFLALAAALILTAGTDRLLSGAAVPYKAPRATFNPGTGYPAGAGEEEASRQFETGLATSSLGLLPEWQPRVSAYSALYFLIGRHTGVLIYFPAALLLAASALRRPDRLTLMVLAAAAATSLFYLLWLPFNWFGGASCIANRYFLVAYAALPLALRRPPGGRVLAIAWGVALLAGGSALVSELRYGGLRPSSQSHAYAGLFRILPYESTASDLEGSRDRFWQREFIRFVDPFAEEGPWSFRLRSGTPAAELEMASLRREGLMRFLVLSPHRDLELHYSDWGHREVFTLFRPYGRRGLVEIRPSLALRRHTLWFRNPWDHGLPYYARPFRLALRTPDGSPAEAELRYLADRDLPARIFASEVLVAELPRRAKAGSTSLLKLRVRNRSAGEWRSDAVLPVYLSYRLRPLAEGAETLEGGRTALPARVRPGRVLSAAVRVEWPQRPGRYRLTLDLVMEGVAWFGDRAGAPLAEGEVRIVSTPDPPRR